MAAVIDMSLFTEARPDIVYWEELQEQTSIAGISASATLTWVGGHVVLSIGAPLAIAEALLGRHRDQPWLRRWGIVLWGVAFVLTAVLIHLAQRQDYGVNPTPAQFAGATAVIAVLAGLAQSPIGRSLSATDRPVPSLLIVGLGGAVVVGVMDFAPYSWLGVALIAAAILGAILALVRWSGSARWGMAHAAAAAFGAIAARAAAGAIAPAPEGVEPVAKLLQGVAGLLLVAGLCWWLWRRCWRADSASKRTAKN
jgi:hypothetical protein